MLDLGTRKIMPMKLDGFFFMKLGITWEVLMSQLTKVMVDLVWTNLVILRLVVEQIFTTFMQ